MHAYQEAMKAAVLAGFYAPELVDCYFRENDFRSPRWFVCQPH